MMPAIKIFKTDLEMAEKLANDLQAALEKAKDQHQYFYLAVSGGTTPITFYKRLTQSPYGTKITWQYLHLFWGDERCVPADQAQSNYGLLRDNMLKHVKIPEKNIHRIHGEADPAEEMRRYSAEIRSTLPTGFTARPHFDWILLGLGNDGHTASIFPGSPAIDEKVQLCAVTVQPGTNQKRITFTLPLINSARRITFIVSGDSKAGMVAKVFKQTKATRSIPATLVHPDHGIVEWYLEAKAAAMITV